MNWGHKIILAFVFFILIMGTLVTVAMKQDFHLVEEEYYKEELAYQGVIDKVENYNSLSVKPEISVNDEEGVLVVEFDENNIPEEGLVHFFRADNPAHDRKINLVKNERGSSYVFDISLMEKGKYLLKLNWKDSSKEYYTEKPIYLQ
ncbi:FixH family protein [Marinigracilibium pacificum]|uniref:FixH protein n=1 Tax=Marinigracilibium pacificum TaxID=2729599 RepID=A0A848J3D7_9BACT|nr:FixH family protein [Marinigracilibium pacificum]NMM50241.1 hypothetical protein [Marinigracilibium pacificum]